jgi:Lactate racemase N-terminal domain
MTDTNLRSSLSLLPKQVFVRARLEDHRLQDTGAETAAQLDAAFSGTDLTGRSVAVAVGSRGIDQLATVVGAAVAKLKSLGARPFIFPAMGSHGGATAEGQREILASFGVTEESIGATINASMDTVEIGRSENNIRVFASRPALEADAMLFINRVKPHTDFSSDRIGSGVRKMLVIGLGKAAGAFECHRYASGPNPKFGYERTLIEVSDFVLNNLPSIFGLALIEDGYHKLARIEALAPRQIASREPELFKLSRAWMPSLPFESIDALIIDEMGKNISGSGMDPNVIGRREGIGRRQEARAIYVRSLTPETHGNAIGVGMADVVSARLVREIDKTSTYTNALAAMSPASVRIPMHFANDFECLSAALRLAGADPAEARVLRVRNTLALDRFVASSSYAAEIAERDDLTVIQSSVDWRFNDEGDFDPTHDLLKI